MTKAAQIGRLRWRCRRGMRELDILLLRYVDDDYGGASRRHQDAFERLLCLQDPEIFGLLTRRDVAEDRCLQDVVECLLKPH